MNQKDAMEYVLKQKRGYRKDLIDAIGEENFKTLSLLGFIKQGKEFNNKDSWTVAKSLKKFLLPYHQKVSLFDKVRYYINSKIG